MEVSLTLFIHNVKSLYKADFIQFYVYYVVSIYSKNE